MKSHEFLVELGNTWYPYSRFATSDYTIFTTDNRHVSVVFIETYDNECLIEFSVGGRRDLTGLGNSFRVLSTVAKIIQQELPKYLNDNPNIDKVEFAANRDEPSRVSLYKRSVPIISSTLGSDWIYDGTLVDKGNLLIFTWSKKPSYQRARL